MNLNSEDFFLKQFIELKDNCGSHSPSVYDLTKKFPNINLKIDACFLCNPYAFDLSYNYIKKIDLESSIRYYPPQNHETAKYVAQYRDISADRLVVGNGAMEIIENIIKNIQNKKILIPIPTFSAYYELASIRNEVVFFQLKKEDGFQIDVEKLQTYINTEKVDYIILVNPSNPSGFHLSVDDIIQIHSNIREEQILLIDESFIDFATDCGSIEAYAENYENIIVVRSLSKDFGIAGMRLGYGFFPRNIKDEIIKAGFLWNSNGLAFNFLKLLTDSDFIRKYENLKEQYKIIRDNFYTELNRIPYLKVYPSQANFLLIETTFDCSFLFTKLLMHHGIYVRMLNDRIGLNGNFIRIACKTRSENKIITKAILNEVNGNIESIIPPRTWTVS